MSSTALLDRRRIAARQSERIEDRPRRRPAAVLRPLAIGVGLAALCAVFAIRCWDAARSASITSDETTHLVRSLRFWMTGDDGAIWELGAPRLPHIAYGLASYSALRQAGRLPATADEDTVTATVVSGDPRVLLPARAVAIGTGALLVLGVFWAAARAWGATSGLIAAGLCTLVPEVLAHSAIAGSDVPFAAAALLALILTALYLKRPSSWRWWSLALAIGLAWAMRHTAILLIPLAVAARAWVAWRASAGEVLSRLARASTSIVGLMAVAFAVLWAGDGLATITLGDVAERSATLSVPTRIGPIDVSRVPVPTSALSLLKQARHQRAGHEAYFLGRRGTRGWPTYFPVAFGLKTPLGLLLLMALTLGWMATQGVGARKTLGARSFRDTPSHSRPWNLVATAMLGLLWLSLIQSHVNIGVRYAILTYPLACVWMARLFEPASLRERVRGLVVILSLAWFAWASFASHPRYLSYFNEIGGGPRSGWLYLADSNLDWGQDFDALKVALPRLGIDEITYDLSSERRLEVPGVLCVRNPPRSQQIVAETPPHRRLYDADGAFIPIFTRYVAVGASRLLGLYSQNDMGGLLTRRLVARVGDSTFLFDMDQPAEDWLAP
jgi:hypothetical protein